MITVKSRYGDPRYFTYHEKDNYTFVSFECLMCRYGLIEGKDDEYLMIDPDGGPYIGVGTDLNFISPDLPKKTVTKISKITGGFRLDHE